MFKVVGSVRRSKQERLVALCMTPRHDLLGALFISTTFNCTSSRTRHPLKPIIGGHLHTFKFALHINPLDLVQLERVVIPARHFHVGNATPQERRQLRQSST